MSSVKRPKIWRLLAFRLTLWYGGVLAAAALGCFFIAYFVVLWAMQSRTDADLLHEAARCAQVFAQGGRAALAAQIDNDSRATGTNDIFFAVFDRDGHIVAASDLSTWSDIQLSAPAAVENGDQFENASGAGHHARVRALTLSLDADNSLRIGITVQDDARVLEQTRRMAGAILIGSIGIAVGVGWLLAKRALTGVQQVTNTANEISQGTLERRVPVSGSGDEIDQLAGTVNQMLARIQSLVEGMKATNDDIAHELRSPITRMRGLAEMTLTGQSTLKEFQEMAASTVEECDELLAMINTMLDIAEAEAGVMNLQKVPLNIAAMIRKLCELYEPVMCEKGLQVQLDLPEVAMACGDVQKLQRVAANLLDNAVKYTPSGGVIGLTVTGLGPVVQVSISNTGQGISPKDMPHIFKRFYRADKSRSGSGNGLGLSLAQAVVHAHGGDIKVMSIPNGQTTFIVTLPTASQAPSRPWPKITN
jgi:heavy metal sensor kinase